MTLPSPSRPRLAFYGDDFTGSTDAMEVLQWAGMETILFLAPPSTKQLESFPHLDAFGIAGWSRTMSPSEMDSELVPALESLEESGAPIIHYKTCSTFDSAPHIGSIGKALEIGQDIFHTNTVPILIGAPQLGRYSVFGNLFARSGLDSEPFRLDHHPTMRSHPITPMTESDIRIHLSQQTQRKIALFDILALEDKNPDQRLEALLETKPQGLLFDVLYPKHLQTIGSLIDELGETSWPLFTLGSSGVEYALTSAWNANKEIPSPPTMGPTEQLIVLSGSCSPVTQRQNELAIKSGFVDIPISTSAIVNPSTTDAAIEEVVALSVQSLKQGKSILLHTALGPSDQRIETTNSAFRNLGFSTLDIQFRNGRTLGPKLGKVLSRILAQHPIPRIGVAGGDTSGYVARELGITAVKAMAPVAPGSPLCRIIADGPLDSVEIIFKGGQVGHPDLWLTMLNGTQS